MKDPTLWVFDGNSNYDPVKHVDERGRDGFSTYDWWNFNSYLCYVIIGGLERFKTGHGYPVYGGINSMDDWVAAIDKMIAGFQARYELDNEFAPSPEMRDSWEAERVSKWEEGSALFIQFFPSLWD